MNHSIMLAIKDSINNEEGRLSPTISEYNRNMSLVKANRATLQSIQATLEELASGLGDELGHETLIDRVNHLVKRIDETLEVEV